MIDRRRLIGGMISGASLLSLGAARADNANELKVLNLGFQKTGIPLIARQLRVFEKRFEPKGIKINWIEFPSGLTLLQALDVGALDFGNAGNVGCIFVQAAGGRIVYVAAQPQAATSEGILVKADSPIKTIADLKGRKVAYAKGSSSHSLLAAALEREGLSLDDIQTVGLGAADALLAFDTDKVDAWVIWDPYFRNAQTRSKTRVLAYNGDVLKDYAQFLLANTSFAEKHPDHVRDLIAGATEAGAWAHEHLDDVTKAVAAATGMDEKLLADVNANANFRVTPLTDPILDSQQATADRLYKIGVVPKQVTIRDIVWHAPS